MAWPSWHEEVEIEERVLPLYRVQISPQSIHSCTEMFSLVSQKVMPQPPSANKKKNYEIEEVLGTGSFGKVMVCPVFLGSLADLTQLDPARHMAHPCLSLYISNGLCRFSVARCHSRGRLEGYCKEESQGE